MRDAIHRKCVEPDLLGHAGPPAPCTERSSNDRRAPQLGDVLAYSATLARPKSAVLPPLASQSQESKNEIARTTQELSKSPPLSRPSVARYALPLRNLENESNDQSRRHRPRPGRLQIRRVPRRTRPPRRLQDRKPESV